MDPLYRDVLEWLQNLNFMQISLRVQATSNKTQQDGQQFANVLFLHFPHRNLSDSFALETWEKKSWGFYFMICPRAYTLQVS